jgi:hypothetical protein
MAVTRISKRRRAMASRIAVTKAVASHSIVPRRSAEAGKRERGGGSYGHELKNTVMQRRGWVSLFKVSRVASVLGQGMAADAFSRGGKARRARVF